MWLTKKTLKSLGQKIAPPTSEKLSFREAVITDDALEFLKR